MEKVIYFICLMNVMEYLIHLKNEKKRPKPLFDMQVNNDF